MVLAVRASGIFGSDLHLIEIADRSGGMTPLPAGTVMGHEFAGIVEAGATERTISEHAAILSALRARDPELAEAAALVHVSTTEAWFRSVLQAEDEPDADANPEPPA